MKIFELHFFTVLRIFVILPILLLFTLNVQHYTLLCPDFFTNFIGEFAKLPETSDFLSSHLTDQTF